MSQATKTGHSYGTNSKQEHAQSGELQPSKDFVQYLKEYAQEKPDVAALWCFGIGFVVGWKLKPW
ncbi:hypothetical protein Mal4_14810 [Maioricimonas rarisocia]|uniref:Uncharacterized protein n=1 Tax=Maioricimonas rarisocia TaxID=2528026 RepID=A0A517Z3U5_9PLAN|nr:hypothetical protein [Maioricimonas rarisocia]QDU37172.1 hypothetical protein Mal4_14810 [Maioricimonas rarisocia]